MSFFQPLLLKYKWVLVLAPLCLLGTSLGTLSGTLLSTLVGDAGVSPSASGPADTAAAAKPRLEDYEIIQARNLFNSESTRSGRPLRPASAATSEDPQDQGLPQVSRSDLSLLGTIAGPEVSRALIRVGQESKSYRIGQEIPGAGTLIEIERRAVTLQAADGTRFMLHLPESGKPATAAAPKTPDAAPPATSGTTGNLYSWPNITSTGENSWRIASSEADRARSNLGELLKQARLVPRVVDGQTNGFTVAMIRPNSFLSALGIKRGDAIVGVNGLNLDSPEKALQIFQQLREAKQISLSLERAGQNMTLEYEVD